jgi:hypothetical protein
MDSFEYGRLAKQEREMSRLHWIRHTSINALRDVRRAWGRRVEIAAWFRDEKHQEVTIPGILIDAWRNSWRRAVERRNPDPFDHLVIR